MVGVHRITSVDFGPWWAWIPLKDVVNKLPAVKYAESLSLQCFYSDLIPSTSSHLYLFLKQFQNSRSLRLTLLSSDQFPWSSFPRKWFLRLTHLDVVDKGQRFDTELYFFGRSLFSWCSDFSYLGGDHAKYLRLQTTFTGRELIGRIIRVSPAARYLSEVRATKSGIKIRG